MTIQTRFLTLATCLLAFALPATVQAGGGKKAGKEGHRMGAGKVLKDCDADHNGKIEGAEIAEVRKAFEADKTGPLKHLDKNSDGQLDDSEITNAHAAHGGKGGKGGKKKNA